MSSRTTIGDEVSGGQADDYSRLTEDLDVIDEVAERERNLRPTVEMESAARVDSRDSRERYAGLTLEAEERVRAREWEIERTMRRYDRRQDSDREARTRRVVAARTPSKTRQVRTGDPRAELSRTVLAVVNQQAARLAESTHGWTTAALSRRIAEHVRSGADVVDAVLETATEARFGPGQIVPIGALEQVAREDVTIRGRVARLFEAHHPAIAQTGLIEDETGIVRFTVWMKSDQPLVREGERVHLGGGVLSFYRERPSIAVLARSRLARLDADRWWE